jgi:hypothetical protein
MFPTHPAVPNINDCAFNLRYQMLTLLYEVPFDPVDVYLGTKDCLV